MCKSSLMHSLTFICYHDLIIYNYACIRKDIYVEFHAKEDNIREGPALRVSPSCVKLFSSTQPTHFKVL